MEEQLANLLQLWRTRLPDLDYEQMRQLSPSGRAARSQLQKCADQLEAVLTHTPFKKEED